jgi:hypothetical protein
MATKQVNGSDSTPISTNNDGGVIKANGSVNSGVVISVSTPRTNLGVFGSTVLDNNSADKAVDEGVFAFNNEGPIAKKISATIGGLPNDFLRSGAGDPANIRSIHKIESVTTRKLTTAIRTNKWNEYSGEFDAGFPEVQVDSFGEDAAANPTREVPGQLNYIAGNENTILVPKSDTYKPKTS